MNNRIFIGIDPGIKGGVAIIYNNTYHVVQCPSTVADMASAIATLNDTGPDIAKYAIIERVHSFPGQGVVSTWKFAQNYGQWLGILATLNIPYIQVTPHKWMSHFGSIPKIKKDRKNYLKHLAQQRYPDAHITLATCDAMLLCGYLRETNKE